MAARTIEIKGFSILRGAMKESSFQALKAASEWIMETGQLNERDQFVDPHLPSPQFCGWNGYHTFSEKRHIDAALCVARQYLKREPYVFGTQLIAKFSHSSPTRMHRDSDTAPTKVGQAVTVWIPFSRASHETAGLGYVAGSHRSRENNNVPPEKIEFPTFAVGDVSIHDFCTLHCSSTNRTADRRLAFAIRLG